MSMDDLPKFNIPKMRVSSHAKKTALWLILVIVISSFCGFTSGIISGGIYYNQIESFLSKLNIRIPEQHLQNPNTSPQSSYVAQDTQEQLVIRAVKKVSPSVVSIIISKNVPVFEEYFSNPFKEFQQFFGEPFQFEIPQYRQKGTEKREIGGGTGFIISEDGMVLTNKHVVSEKDAEYTVFTNDGKKYPAKVLAKDPAQDFAILKIESDRKFRPVSFGDSDKLQIGQTVIAIGNALGEFRNTVSVGVVSGLGRTITASGAGLVETIEDVIQTDAAINRGNSGGPLLNLKGEVVGINTATVVGAQNIGFAIPIDKVKISIEKFKQTGKITYPFLGVRYVLVTKEIQEKNNLPVDYGALIARGRNGESAVIPGSAAENAGLKEGDIILKFNGEKITTQNSLSKIIMKYKPGDKVNLEVLRNGKKISIEATLGERSG